MHIPISLELIWLPLLSLLQDSFISLDLYQYPVVLHTDNDFNRSIVFTEQMVTLFVVSDAAFTLKMMHWHQPTGPPAINYWYEKNKCGPLHSFFLYNHSYTWSRKFFVTVYCTVYFTMYCTVYNTIRSAVYVYYTINSSVYCTVYCTVYDIICCTIYLHCTMNCAVYCTAYCTICCAVYCSVHCTVYYNVYCTVYSILHCELQVPFNHCRTAEQLALDSKLAKRLKLEFVTAEAPLVSKFLRLKDLAAAPSENSKPAKANLQSGKKKQAKRASPTNFSIPLLHRTVALPWYYAACSIEGALDSYQNEFTMAQYAKASKSKRSKDLAAAQSESFRPAKANPNSGNDKQVKSKKGQSINIERDFQLQYVCDSNGWYLIAIACLVRGLSSAMQNIISQYDLLIVPPGSEPETTRSISWMNVISWRLVRPRSQIFRRGQCITSFDRHRTAGQIILEHKLAKGFSSNVEGDGPTISEIRYIKSKRTFKRRRLNNSTPEEVRAAKGFSSNIGDGPFWLNRVPTHKNVSPFKRQKLAGPTLKFNLCKRKAGCELNKFLPKKQKILHNFSLATAHIDFLMSGLFQTYKGRIFKNKKIQAKKKESKFMKQCEQYTAQSTATNIITRYSRLKEKPLSPITTDMPLQSFEQVLRDTLHQILFKRQRPSMRKFRNTFKRNSNSCVNTIPVKPRGKNNFTSKRRRINATKLFCSLFPFNASRIHSLCNNRRKSKKEQLKDGIFPKIRD